MQLVFQQESDLADAGHLLDFFGRKLELEALFKGQHEVEVLGRIPRLDCLWGRLRGDV